MAEKPTYDELEKRIAELEQQVDHYKAAGLQSSPEELLSVLMEAFRYIPTCKTFEDAAKEIFNQCKLLTGAKSGYVALLSENGEENEVLFLDAGGLPCDVDPNLPMPIRGLREVAYKTKDVAYDNDFTKSPWMKYMPEGHVKLENVLFSPLNIESKTVGVIGLANKPGGFSNGDVHNAKILGDLAAVALTYALSQDSLRESEIKYRHLVSNLPGTAYQFLLTPKGDFEFEYIGENCVELFGISASEIMVDANVVFDLIPQPDADIVHNAIMDSAASLSPYHVEHRFQKKNGGTVWILASSIPRKLDDGSIIWDGIGLDITRRKKAEQALKESRGNLMSLIDNTDDIIISRDREGRAIVYNRPFKQIVKTLFNVEAAPGIRTMDYLPEEAKKYWEESLALVLDSGVRRREEFKWKVSGKTHCYEISHSPIQVEGKIIGTTEFTRDITDRKEIEEALRVSEKRCRSIFETISEGIILQDASGKILSWNKGAENIFGISAKEVLNRKSESQDWHTIREDGSRYEGKDHPFMITLKTGKPCRNEIMGVYKPSGELRWISVNTNPMFSGVDEMPYAVVISFSEITEFKQTVEALADSERKWRNILTYTPQIGISLNPKAEIVFANEHFLSLTGWSIHEVIGQDWFDMFIPEPTRQEIRDVFRTIFRKKDASEFTGYNNEILTKNGELRTIAWSNVLTKCASGEILDVTCLGIDVSERQRYEKELKESEIKYRQLTETMLETLSVVDLNGVFLYANRNAARNLSDGKLDDITGKNIRQFLPENQAERLIRQYKEVYSSKKPYSQEVLVHLKKGTTWFSNTLKPIDFGPSQVPGVLSVSLDITERKAAENELRESEEKFRNFTEQSFVGFYIIQDDFFKYVNPKFADIFGYTVDECMDDMSFRQLVHTEDLALVQEQVRRRVDGEIDTVQYTFRGVKKSGEVIHLSIHGSSLTYQGRPAAIGTMLDITKDLEMEKRLAQSQRLESIGNLAGGIAHDFNNILFPIVGMSELLLEDLPEGTPEYENTEEILRAGKRGSDLVKQILAFSRQSEHKVMPIRIQTILKEVTKLSRASIPTYIEIHQDIQPDCGKVMADSTQIHQVAMNIMTNAFHAVEAGGGSITVQLKEISIPQGKPQNKPFSAGKYALLSITDTGHGMSEEIKNKIFEPYFTTKEKGKGTGLGLAVVYGIVKEFGGDIQVYSELGSGTTFNIYMPLMKKTADIELRILKSEIQTGDEHILLVDDELPITRLVQLMLERLGYTVTAQLSSIEALEAFKENPDRFDMVISDMSMPNMTGDQLACEVKQIRPNMPIILCTGFSERINKEKAEEIGVNGFLMKPIVKSDMAQMIRKVLDEK